MDEGNPANGADGDTLSNTSGQNVKASPDPVVKPVPTNDDIVPLVPNNGGESVDKPGTDDSTILKSEKVPESEGETHGPSDAWQPSLQTSGNRSRDSLDDQPAQLSTVSGGTTPPASLQNLDDLKLELKSQQPFQEPAMSGKDESTHAGQATPKQPVEKSSLRKSLPSHLTSPNDSTDGEELVRKKKDKDAKFKLGKDFFCWICHKDKANVSCGKCPRSFHPKCLLSSGFQHSSITAGGRKRSSNSHDITCPECKSIEDLERRPPKALKSVSREELNSLLIFAVESVKPSADPSFHTPVIKSMFPDYYENIVHPTDFQMITAKVKNNEYTSTQAFISDMRWIVHNCSIYNNHTNALTMNAKSFMKLTVTKIVDLEICPDCFKNYHVKQKTWFTEVCRKPHAIVWAKVIGHPFWPGKVVQIDALKKEADVRFFGAHDRAWLSIDQCFLITENNSKAKGKNSKSKFDAALKELNEHIQKIATKFTIKFPYAESPKTVFDYKKPFVKIPKADGELSSAEEEDDFLNDVDGPGLQIDESFIPEPTDDESDASRTGIKNGSGGVSDVDSKPRSARKRKSSSVKSGDTDDAKVRKLPQAKKEVKKEIKSEVKSIDAPGLLSPTSVPLEDPTPIVSKDIPSANQEVERLKLLLVQEQRKCTLSIQEEQKKSELLIADLKQSFIKDKEKALRDSRARQEQLHAVAIAETKKQQWCAHCSQPAVYYCCWNTSYCSYDCQNGHWTFHMNTCQQSRQTQHTNSTFNNNSK